MGNACSKTGVGTAAPQCNWCGSKACQVTLSTDQLSGFEFRAEMDDMFFPPFFFEVAKLGMCVVVLLVVWAQVIPPTQLSSLPVLCVYVPGGCEESLGRCAK